MKLVSACLAGFNCQWNGKSKPSKEIIELVKQGKAIPVCPEQLGGLTTPRIPSEQRENLIINKQGINVTEQFNKGAQEVLKIAKQYNVKEFIGYQKSPSCGCGLIYDGTFSGNTIKGNGITSSLLKKNGIKVIPINP